MPMPRKIFAYNLRRFLRQDHKDLSIKHCITTVSLRKFSVSFKTFNRFEDDSTPNYGSVLVRRRSENNVNGEILVFSKAV